MRVRVLVPHVLGAGVLARRGEVIELTEHVARQRLALGYVEPAPSEAAPVASAEPGPGVAGEEPAVPGAPASGEPTAAPTAGGEPGSHAGVPDQAPDVPAEAAVPPDETDHAVPPDPAGAAGPPAKPRQRR